MELAEAQQSSYFVDVRRLVESHGLEWMSRWLLPEEHLQFESVDSPTLGRLVGTAPEGGAVLLTPLVALISVRWRWSTCSQ